MNLKNSASVNLSQVINAWKAKCGIILSKKTRMKKQTMINLKIKGIIIL